MSNDAKTKERLRIAVFFGLCILLVVGVFVSIGSGTVSLSVSETWAALLGEADADTDRIVNLIRLPRTIVTVLVGANLALAGCNLQGVLHNPLADPGIIGVSAGAGLFAMVIMLLFPEQSAMVPVAAFVGAVLSTGIVFFLAWEKGINPLRMILAGVAVATFFGGGMAALNVFYSDRIQGTVMWMAGGFQGRSWGHVEMLLPYSAIGIIGTILCARSLNALQLGDELAKSLGVRVMRMRTILIFLSALLAAGMILFGRHVVALFISADAANAAEALSVAYDYLVVMSTFLLSAYVLHTYRSALQGMGFTTAPMLSGLTEFAGRVGASLLLTKAIGERGLFYTDAAAWTFAAVFLAASYYIQLFIIRKKGLTYQNTK